MKLVLCCLLSVLLLACGSGPIVEKRTIVYADTVTEEVMSDTIAEPPPADHAGLSLHNGVKWKADARTLANVSLLKKLVADALKQNPVNYSLTAEALQKGLDKMVSECSMKGPDHEALHQWLLPLVKNVHTLKKVSVENAVVMLHEIEAQIQLFDQYFD